MDQGVCCLLPLGPPTDRRRIVQRPTVVGTGRDWQRAGGRRVAQALTVGGDACLNGPAEALPQMEPVGYLQSVRGTAPGAVGIGARPVPADDLHARVTSQPGGQWPGFAGREHIDHAMVFDAGQDGGVGLATTDREVVHAQDRGVLNRGSGNVMTLRNKVIRPAPKPNWAANRAPARPASASPTRSRAWLSRAVNRAYGTASRENGSANVRRGQSGTPQMKRRTVNRITKPCSASGRSFSLRWYRSWTRSEKRSQSGQAAPTARASHHHLDCVERGRNRLDFYIVDPVEHQRVQERCIGLHDQHHHG